MTRSDEERVADILNAIDRCQDYEQYLRSEEFGSMAYDAVLRNLGVIGEAVRALPPAPAHEREPQVRHRLTCGFLVSTPRRPATVQRFEPARAS